MAEYKRPKNFAEAIAMYTGSPVREPKEREPLTEEQRQKWEEFEKKLQSLSREERLKFYKTGKYADLIGMEQDK